VRRLRAILALRCPRCREGTVWRGVVTMNERCSRCGLVFEREPGYFTGAMVVSYLLAVPAFAVIWLLLWLGAGWDIRVALAVAIVAFLFLVPAIFRYSRVLWLYFDHAVDPER